MRKFVPISIEALKAKIEALEFDDLVDQIAPDLKVKFDWENFDYKNPKNGGDDLCGYHNIDGLSFRGCVAGGDWQAGVFHLIYFDGKRLRAYVPTKGNPWNRSTKTAYGDDDEADFADAKKQLPDYFRDKTLDDWDPSMMDIDWTQIREDIRGHFAFAKPQQAGPQRVVRDHYTRALDLKKPDTGDETEYLFGCGLEFLRVLRDCSNKEWSKQVFAMLKDISQATEKDRKAG